MRYKNRFVCWFVSAPFGSKRVVLMPCVMPTAPAQPTIKELARRENVEPYIVIGRLQKEKHLTYQAYAQEKARYKWAD